MYLVIIDIKVNNNCGSDHNYENVSKKLFKIKEDAMRECKKVINDFYEKFPYYKELINKASGSPSEYEDDVKYEYYFEFYPTNCSYRECCGVYGVIDVKFFVVKCLMQMNENDDIREQLLHNYANVDECEIYECTECGHKYYYLKS